MKKTNRNRNRKTKQTFSNIHENDGLVENIFKFKNLFFKKLHRNSNSNSLKSNAIE